MSGSWTETDVPRVPDGAVVCMQQHPTYADTCRIIGLRCVGLSFSEGRRTLASAQILVRRWPLMGSFALLSRGPVWSPDLDPAACEAVLGALIGLLKARFRGVMATPDPVGGRDPLRAARMLAMYTPCHIAELALDAPEQDLRARLHGKWRNTLRRAESAGLEIRDEPLPAEPGHWVLRAEEAQSRARGYRRIPPAFAAQWADAGGAGATRLFTALRGGKPVAAMMFLLHGRGASYHIGWSGPEGRRSAAHALLLWRAILWLSGRGYSRLDLGTLDTEGAAGLARFKLGCGARPLALGATRIAAPGTAPICRLQEFAARREGAGGPLCPAGATPTRRARLSPVPACSPPRAPSADSAAVSDRSRSFSATG